VPRLQKLAARAQVGYLTGYNSTNIYRVWIPRLQKVICTRDVTFNESAFFSPHDKQHPIETIRELVELLAIEVLPSIELSNENSDISYSSLDVVSSPASPALAPTQHSPITASPATLAQDSLSLSPPASLNRFEKARSEPMLSASDTTPNDTPEPSPPPAPRADEISATVDPANILVGKRTRKPTRRQAYLADLASTAELPGLFAAFSAATQHGKKRLHRDALPPPPRTWKQLEKHPFCDSFKQAASLEYDTLKSKGTFEPVPTPTTTTERVLPLLWVFTYKFDPDGFLLKFKARICVRGDLQPSRPGDDYAATLAAKTFRALMAICAAFDLEVQHLDVVSAFVNSPIDGDVYCAFPDGFQQPGHCLRLYRALYGLRQSPRLWLRELSSTLVSLGLRPVEGQECLYTNGHNLLFFYVDDIALIGKDVESIHHLKQDLMSRYEIRDLGPLEWFLGIRVLRDRPGKKLWLSQDSYVEKLLATFNIDPSKPVHSPMSTEELLPHNAVASAQEIYSYQRKLGSILYAATISRPDIARTTN
jgi:hypothetical protein